MMLAALRNRLRWLRRRISRNEAMVRWLRLSRPATPAQEPGLVFVQIDGLSRHQLERALKHRRMPFLRRLMRKRGYRLHTIYSGLPSSTPAVQGELFYGAKCAVPAFSYRDHETGQIVRMYETASAGHVQQCLAEQGAGLLEGGSAYSNIYSGGAAVSHFCAATMGWSGVAHVIKPWVLVSILFWHAWSIVRALTLVVVEVVLAIFDFVRRQSGRMALKTELKFIPMRVGVCVLLRELITAAAAVDVTRGLPVVQLNLLGYDEQSHHRGPSSAFAHWSLKGIDDAIKRVYTAARRSQYRKYTLWVYSDHGQERTTPYALKYGRTIQQAIAEVFGRDVITEPSSQHAVAHGIQYSRAEWIGGKTGRRLTRHHRKRRTTPASAPVSAPAPPTAHASTPTAAGAASSMPAAGISATSSTSVPASPPAAQGAPPVEVISMGPIGLVYAREQLSAERLQQIAEELVHSKGVPMVLAPNGPDAAWAWTRSGRFKLPAQGNAVLGADHPFALEVAHDLVELCHHPHAGCLIVCGWSHDRPALSFAMEKGSHGGPGPEETRAFLLAPADAPIPQKEQSYLRMLDLRIAAMRFMGRSATGAKLSAPQGDDKEPTVAAAAV